MDGEVEEVSEGEEQHIDEAEEEWPENHKEGETHEEEKEIEGQAYAQLIREAHRLPTAELELRLSALKEVIGGRQTVEEEEELEEEEGLEAEGAEQSGKSPLRGACKGKTRKKPTRAVIQKRTAAKERKIRKCFAEMESELNATCWCFGYTTATGKLRVAGAESMTDWMARRYRAEALKVHLSYRGESQQATAAMAGLDLAVLMDMLNTKQLSSLASGWFKRCDPSLKHFPLDNSKGTPPWWPGDVAFQQASSLRKPALVRAVTAAAKSICLNNTSSLAEQKLERAIATSQVLCNETLEVRAILHSAIAQAVRQWKASEESTGGEAENGGAPREAPQQTRDGPGLQEGQGAGAGCGGSAGGGEADNKEQGGPFAGLGGQRKRRRACDISGRPFKCPDAACASHRGFTTKSGLSKHSKAKHSIASAQTNAENGPSTLPDGPSEKDSPAPTVPEAAAEGLRGNNPERPEDNAPPPAPSKSVPPMPASPSRGPTQGMHSKTDNSMPDSGWEASEASPKQTAARPAGARATSPPARPKAASKAPVPAAAAQTGPSEESHARASAQTPAPPNGGPSSTVEDAQKRCPKGSRSKRAPKTIPNPAKSPAPLQSVDENLPEPKGQKRKHVKPPGVVCESLEDYVDFMTSRSREKRRRDDGSTYPAPIATSAQIMIAAKRRAAKLDRVRASQPRHIAHKAMIDALEARPCKRLYRTAGEDSFELLVSGTARSGEYVALRSVNLEVLIAFAKASKIENGGVGERSLRRKIQEALELELLRDHNLLPENGDHLR